MGKYMKRPFAVEIAPANAAGELRLQVTFQAAVELDLAEQVELVVGEFVGLAWSGALGSAELYPADTSITAGTPHTAASGVSQTFLRVELAPAALTCLLNMLEWVHYHVTPLSCVRIAWDAAAVEPQPLELGFPSVWSAPGFSVEVDELERRFEIEILFSDPLPEAEAEAINGHLGLWFAAVGRGAYGDARIPPKDSVIYFTDDVIETSAQRTIWFIDVFRCADAALDGLINALASAHRRLAKIEGLVIG
jgi:hypothetical protein